MEVKIESFAESVLFLKDHLGDATGRLLKTLRKWPLEEWRNLSFMERDVREKIEMLMSITFARPEVSSKHLRAALECCVFHELHDAIMGQLYYHFKEEDDFLFEKCKRLDRCGFTIEELGASKEYDIKLPASVVELARLDSLRSILEKTSCLATTYDMIFAELKTALAEVIAESPESEEGEIPIVNDSDVTPILVGVIIRAKPKHLFTNLYYIQAFGSNEDHYTGYKVMLHNLYIVGDSDVTLILVGVIIRAKPKHLFTNLYYIQAFDSNENHYTGRILDKFQIAVQDIVDIDEELLGSNSEKSGKGLDLAEYSKLVHRDVSTSLESLCDNQMKRLKRQISSSLEQIDE